MAAALRGLAAEEDPFLLKTVAAHGVHADRYRLRIPDRWFDPARRMKWRPGSIEALHPVFRALGPVAGLVYEVLTTAPATWLDTAAEAAVSERAAWAALHLLAEHGLAVHGPRKGWTRGNASLDDLAAELDAGELHERQARRYRRERRIWHRYLGVDIQQSNAVNPRPLPRASSENWRTVEPDPEVVTALEILYEVLGATPYI